VDHLTEKLKCRRLGYLGPEGTFTGEALKYSLEGLYEEAVPFSTVEESIRAVVEGAADRALVPLENSIEGSVNATLDTLAFDVDLFIQAEVVYPVSHVLLARKGVSLEQVETVASHPHAAAQCRASLARLVPGATVVAANSTSEAAAGAARSDQPVAALGNRLSAEIYGLEVIAEDLEDHPGNLTRFALLGKEKMPPTGRDKTSLVCFIHADQPGSLLMILQEFAYRYINLSKIESRPTKASLGQYCFFIDCDGHEDDEVVASAVKCLRCKLREVKMLGSYPRFREEGEE
jgi:prephenate dehydratase